MNKEDFLFNKLHPICTDLVKMPNKHKLNNYYETVKTLIANDYHSAVNNMDEYLFIPMLTVLKDHAWTLDMDSYEYIYLTLALLVKSCRLKKPTLFQHILNLITYNNEFMRKKKMSEEYTRSYFDLIREMIVSSNSDVLVRFYTLANMATIGLLVSTFVDCLCADESSLSLRLQSVDLLNVLINHDDKRTNIDLLSSIFTSFLPGITIGIVQRFLMKANINLLNHRIICECLGFLSGFLCLVLNDTQFSADDKQCKPTKPIDLNLHDKLKDMVIDKHNNKEWQDKTQKNLNVLLGSLLGLLKSHDSRAIRLGLVDLLSNLIDKCPTFFIHAAPHDVYFNLFLNLLIEYNGCVDDDDDDRKIKSRSLLCLNKLKALKTQDLFRTCLNGLNEVIAKTPMATNKRSHLKLINGYLAYLSCGFDEKKFFLTNTDSLVGLENALIACVQFDYKNLNNLIQINTNVDDYDTDGFNYANQLGSYRQLKVFLNDDRIHGHQYLEAICRVLGHNDTVSRMFLDCLLYANTSGDFKLTERLFLVNLIVLGSNATANNDDLIENLMGYLISFDNERSTSVTSAYMAVDKQNEIIILKCIVLETILNCSRLLSKNTANKFLIHTLSFILVSYMNENSHVKLCSIKCLHELSRNFNESCPKALLAHNYDYVISHLLVDLNDKLNHQTLCILCSLCDICDMTLNVHLERILNLVLFKLEFLLGLTSSDDLLLMLLRFLVRLSVAYERWFHGTNHMAIESAKARSLCKSIESGTFKRTIVDLKQSIVDYKDKLDECQATTTDDVQNDGNQVDDDQVDSGNKAEARIESHVKIQSQILDKCQHMISHPNEQLRLLTIDLIRHLALNLHENKNSLLPMVHKLWSPICKRFVHDKHAFIRTKIFNLVFNLSRISGDFIRDRFVRDLLPYINEFMAKQCLVSFNHKQRNDTTYTFTNEFKMQCEILMRIHDMCIFMDIKQYALESVFGNILLGYLDRHQPARLQELALKSLEVFAKFDPDIVWLCLHYIIPFGNLRDHVLKPTDEIFSLIESLSYTDKIGLKLNLAFEQPILVGLLKVFVGL